MPYREIPRTIHFFILVVFLGTVTIPAFGAKPECENGICEGNERKTCPVDCPVDPPTEPPGGVPSCGCVTGLPSQQARPGRTYVRDLVLVGNPTTKYEIRLPSNYDVNAPGGLPVLVFLHGWGGSFRSLPTQFAKHAKNNGYIVVTPSGYGDGGRNSWNGFRSARLPNCDRGGPDCAAGPPEGPSTCVDIDGSGHNYCYDSCGDCPKWDGSLGDNTWNTGEFNFNGDYTCYWTTCRDSVAQIAAILDDIEKDYCVDRSRIWVSGCSNGGMFVYELAKDPRTSNRFAVFLPQVGAPHPGFVQADTNWTSSKYFMGFWGLSDTTVPGIADPDLQDIFGSDVALDTNFNGWLYMTADSIVDQWVQLNGLSEDDSIDPYDASSYSSSLDCKAWAPGSSPEDVEIVRCFFSGGHSCPGFGNMPAMMRNFALGRPLAVEQEFCQ